MKRAVFLDRDGVLIAAFVRGGVSYPAQNVAEIQVLPGVEQGLETLRQLGFMRIVVSNQPDVARGVQTAAGVEAINQAIAARVPIDEFRVCMHDNGDHCDCRKPKPGLLLAAARAHGLDMLHCFMVGDRATDVSAGQAAGCRTFLVERSYSKKAECQPDFAVYDLAEAAQIIAGLVNRERSSR